MNGAFAGFPFDMGDIMALLRLKVRRRSGNSVYTDCPICGDQRGKMNISLEKNLWRCNYCGEGGGMLSLYGRVRNISNGEAYQEITELLLTGNQDNGTRNRWQSHGRRMGHENPKIPQTERASDEEVADTYETMLGMLTLRAQHIRHLTSPKRGLNQEQIAYLGYRSTPPPELAEQLTAALIRKGYTVAGVPGFYRTQNGRWSVKFSRRASGILLPVRSMDRRIRGMQILLDKPIKDPQDAPEKSGCKYIWLTSAGKREGVTSGSPIHFCGTLPAHTVYLTEGILKADIAQLYMQRTFLAVAGVNNTGSLGETFAELHNRGTELMVEAYDMDKYSNKMVQNGAWKSYLIAESVGMKYQRLTWNPSYKGIDDWQLSLSRT